MFTLVLGGARSGKSAYAQQLCSRDRPVVFIATARIQDDEMRARAEHHRRSRPASWRTIKAPLDLAPVIRETPPANATLLVDCATVWLSNLFWQYRDLSTADRLDRVARAVDDVAAAASVREIVIVSNELGSGLVPESPLGREFRDAHGRANQALARAASRVVLIVAGLPLTLKDEQG